MLGHLTNLDIVRQGPTVLAVCANIWFFFFCFFLDIFLSTVISHFFFTLFGDHHGSIETEILFNPKLITNQPISFYPSV